MIYEILQSFLPYWLWVNMLLALWQIWLALCCSLHAVEEHNLAGSSWLSHFLFLFVLLKAAFPKNNWLLLVFLWDGSSNVFPSFGRRWESRLCSQKSSSSLIHLIYTAQWWQIASLQKWLKIDWKVWMILIGLIVVTWSLKPFHWVKKLFEPTTRFYLWTSLHS